MKVLTVLVRRYIADRLYYLLFSEARIFTEDDLFLHTYLPTYLLTYLPTYLLLHRKLECES